MSERWKLWACRGSPDAAGKGGILEERVFGHAESSRGVRLSIGGQVVEIGGGVGEFSTVFSKKRTSGQNQACAAPGRRNGIRMKLLKFRVDWS